MRSTKLVWDKDSLGKANYFEKNKSRAEDKKGACTLKKLDSTLPRLKGDIQDTKSVSGPNLNLNDLQRDLTTLTSKYELLQHNACYSRKGHQKLEWERGVWILD